MLPGDAQQMPGFLLMPSSIGIPIQKAAKATIHLFFMYFLRIFGLSGANYRKEVWPAPKLARGGDWQTYLGLFSNFCENGKGWIGKPDLGILTLEMQVSGA